MHRFVAASYSAVVKTPSSSAGSSEVVPSDMLSPTESPMNRIEFDDATSRLIARIVKPCDGNPYDERKSSALNTIEPFSPAIRTRLSQTPTNGVVGSGSVDAAVIVPRPNALPTRSASTIRVHRWLGLAATSSAGSSTDGNVPPAVRGPFDAENSVAAMVPFENRRTRFAVSAMARLVFAHSNGRVSALARPTARRRRQR